jgi:hypothetical protein
MSRPRPISEPVTWTDILGPDGIKIGSWAIRKGMLVVRNMTGGEKSVMRSHGGANAGLAQIVVRELKDANCALYFDD